MAVANGTTINGCSASISSTMILRFIDNATMLHRDLVHSMAR